jgi:hypothetical protein
MCEFTQKIIGLKRAMSGNSVIPINFRPRYQYQNVQEEHCPECGIKLPLEFRRPSGRTTRSLCEWCYTSLIANTINYYCFICRQRLPEYKVHAQMKKQREISHHIDDGYCLDYFTLVHCKVVGSVDMTFLGDERGMQSGQIFPQNQHYLPAPYTYINEPSPQVLRQIENPKKMISWNPLERQALPDRKIMDFSNRYLLDEPTQQDSVEFCAKEMNINKDTAENNVSTSFCYKMKTRLEELTIIRFDHNWGWYSYNHERYKRDLKALKQFKAQVSEWEKPIF